MRWQHQRTPINSGDLRVLLETHWGFLSVKEHREETLICDVEVVKSNAMTKSKNTGRICWSEGYLGDSLGTFLLSKNTEGRRWFVSWSYKVLWFCKIKEEQEDLMIWRLLGRHTGALFLSKNTKRRWWFMILRLHYSLRWRIQRTPGESGDLRVIWETRDALGAFLLSKNTEGRRWRMMLRL